MAGMNSTGSIYIVTLSCQPIRLRPAAAKHDCVESSLIELSEARIQVPAKIADCKIGAHGPYLRPPAEAAGADDRSMT